MTPGGWADRTGTGEDEAHEAAIEGVRVPAATVDWTASRVVQSLVDADAVNVVIDGQHLVAWLEVDLGEHRRRESAEIGAITSTGLLHALWQLPTGGRVEATALASAKVDRLRSAPHSVLESGASFERLYSPPGTVCTVAFVGRSGRALIDRAIRFTPIVQRLAILVDPTACVSPRHLATAREWGVGVVQVSDDAVLQLVDPAPSEKGVPSVYRWWIAELAYRSWLTRTPNP